MTMHERPETSSTWLDNTLREAGIRKSLIVYGQIGDLCRNPENGQYQPVLPVLAAELKRRGFDEVIVWDRIQGIDYSMVSRHYVAELTRECIQTGQDRGGAATDNGYPGAQQEQGGRAFRLDDEEEEELYTSVPSLPLKAPEEFFPLVASAMSRDSYKKTAFILDWSNFLFGSSNNLTEPERMWLTQLSKAIRNAPDALQQESVGKPSNLIILFTPNLAAIPPVFYQNNPAVKQIHVPLPTRQERKAYLYDQGMKFRLAVPLAGADAAALDEVVDSLEGFTIRDMQQCIRLSRQTESALTMEKLVNLYKYGEKSSPWEELSRQRIKNIEQTLKERVKGQDQAIRKVKDVIIRAFTGFSGLQHSAKTRKPKGILFFVGPTGVGKTELAKSLADFLFKDENACIRFDMSEFNHEHSDQRLVGAPPGYVGYEEGGQLTNAVKARPFSVLLFDEIEKAHSRILDKFLQILEDGRLTDGKGETVYFSESVIIFTSNIGAAEVSLSDDRKETEREFKEKIREHFVNKLNRPELLNRIGDNIVVFHHIQDEDFMMEIARVKWKPVVQYIKEKYKMELVFEDEDASFRAIVRAVDKSNGGRGILNVIEPKLIDPLARFIFEESELFSEGRKIFIVKAPNSANFDFEIR
ncbi:AAA family ATPase [Paenibacillus urinalis]|uniref:AAA family ATPase n=1 Tax=Paenibacillus urinalis TaxID=521520 RepID=A0AAX3N2S7_9BACL|nr:AAA family ATPase [Paenibacillus urinalis]WDH83329.1 AAA family ATPase [Paenibacillus urinalis]